MNNLYLTACILFGIFVSIYGVIGWTIVHVQRRVITRQRIVIDWLKGAVGTKSQLDNSIENQPQ